jgi:hypothetical protein
MDDAATELPALIRPARRSSSTAPRLSLSLGAPAARSLAWRAGGAALLAVALLLYLLIAVSVSGASPFRARRCAGSDSARANSQAAVAVVMPVVPCQLHQRLTANLRSWQLTPPCDPAKLHHLREFGTLSLVFYFNGNLADRAPASAGADAGQSVHDMLSALWNSLGPHRACFDGGVHYVSANLTEHEDKYPVGTCLQFHRAFPLLRNLGFDHWLLMEPDVLPIRPSWGVRIAELAAGNRHCRSFWQAGSVPVFKDESYDVLHLKDKAHYKADTHLNGNALYCLADAAFDDFFAHVQRVSRHGFCGEMQYGYDFAMWKFRNHHANRRYMNFRFSKFVVSDFIANFGDEPYDAEQLRREHSGLVLVHGKSVFDDKEVFSACSMQQRARALEKHDPVPDVALTLPPACFTRVLSQDFRRFDYSYILSGSAAQVESAEGGVQLTSDTPSQIGRLEIDSLHRLPALCAGHAGSCRLFAQFDFRIGRDALTGEPELADGMAIAFVNGSAQLPGMTKMVTVGGVIVPSEALVVLLDEHDNGSDGVGYAMLDTRGKQTRVLARHRGLHARYLRGENVAMRVEVLDGGGVMTFVMDGDRLFEPVTLEPMFPDLFYVVVSANTGDIAVAHLLSSLQLCLIHD